MLKQSEVDAREEALRLLVRELPDEQRKTFYERAEKELKDPDTFAVLNYLFIAGLHHFYLGRWLRGLINLVVFSAGIYLIYLDRWSNGLIIIGIITVLEFYALFRSQIIVKHYNNRISADILDAVKIP
ncbi:MAG: TM2 domain-containing protein [Mariprofundaceae bacterium]|nr:TM2 domain-containing protein [Mariprofundaceae bacterium]